MRLHELAKEIGVSSKDLLSLAREIGLNVKSHSSNLAAGEESILRFAIKQELEEQAAAKASERAAQAAAMKEASEGTRGEQADTGEQAAEAEEQGTEASPGPEGASAEAPALEGTTAQEEQEAAAAETQAAAEASAEEAREGEPEQKTKPVAKIKKMPPRRPGATILGRIDLPPPPQQTDDARKSVQSKERTPDRGVPGTSGQDSAAARRSDSTPVGRPSEKRPDDRRVEETPEAEEIVKGKRFIKPKLQETVFDPDDDPLLQGIRIRHWDRHTRPKRAGWKPGARGKRRLRRLEPAELKKVAVVPPIALKDLSSLLGIKAQDMLVSLMKNGIVAHINSFLDEEAVLQIAVNFNREIEILEKKDLERDFLEKQESGEVEGAEMEYRAPIVTFLGHVDHGKTSLLDAIRETNVVATEDGGITQHVSAYKVTTANGQSVVFLDTPGHRAFTEMRARGANLTDIVVLVVAADDGVMPQTEEAIQHAQAAEVSVVIAINKVDKPNANVSRVKQQLAGLGLMIEEYGGEIGCVEVSAITRAGLPELLDRLVLEAEIQELKSNPNQYAQGVVLEARKDEEVGNIVTLLVQDGTLAIRDDLLAGESHGRVRALVNDQGVAISQAGPSTPVNVIGFDSLPEAGDRFMKVEDPAKAREIAELRHERSRAERLAPVGRYSITLENLFDSIEAGKIKEIRIILKADVKGTLEVLRRSLSELIHQEVKIKLLRDGLGGITEDDVLLAIASNAVIVGFHVLPEDKARRLADDNGVEIRTYRVIYQLLDDLKAAMEGVLEPLKRENVTGHIEIRAVFKSSRMGNIAGCFVTDGTVHRSNKVRVLRDKRVIYDGELASLKRFKDDQREVKEGFECGVKIAGFDDIQEGDVLEAYEIVMEKRTLNLEG